MAPPDDSALEAELSAAVIELLKTDRDALTVNVVRQKVEEKLGLESGFFKSAEWKARSKELIEKTNVCPLATRGEPQERTSRERTGWNANLACVSIERF